MLSQLHESHSLEFLDLNQESTTRSETTKMLSDLFSSPPIDPQNNLFMHDMSEIEIGEAHQKSPKTVAVIGGGIAGCTSALKLAGAGYKVDLYESAEHLLSRTSDATPCRLGVGFHYMDTNTAILTLRTNIDLVRYLIRKTGNHFQVQNYDNGRFSPKRIYYVIAKETVVPLDEIREIFTQIREEYRRLVEKDPENAVFGPVENFYQEIDKMTLTGTIKVEDVLTVYDTCESLFDWPLFKPFLIGEVHSNPKIKVHTETNVLSIQRGEDLKMVVKSQLGDRQYDFLVNSSWHNADQLNQNLEVRDYHCQTINRVKCMAIVELPKSLRNKSFLFGYGPFCALSSRNIEGRDTGYLTYEPVTNILQLQSDAQWTDEQKKYVNGEIPISQKIELGHQILEGASQFIPDLKHAKFLELKMGVVRTDGGEVDIYSRDKHFARDFMGVYPLTLGIVVNEARKHTYWHENSKKTVELIDNQVAMKNEINTICDEIQEVKKAASKDLKRSLGDSISRSFMRHPGEAPARAESFTEQLSKFHLCAVNKVIGSRQLDHEGITPSRAI